MRLAAAAADYDGTLAEAGILTRATAAGFRELREGGMPLVLVTGRRYADLRLVCPEADGLFDRIVAENGAVLVTAGRSRPLAPPLPRALEEELRRRKVRLERGEVLLATDVRFEREVAETVAALRIPCDGIRNRDALMLLPAGVDKASGFAAAARDLGIDPGAFVAFGDAENDAPFLGVAGLGVAMGNAVPGLKDLADVVLDGAGGGAVVEYLRGPVLRGEVVPRRGPRLR
jgi:hydroxymethylpyrimidine pyrophosphatase-like HAD family hydrolase